MVNLAEGGMGAPSPRASHSLSLRRVKPVSSDQLSQSKVVKMWFMSTLCAAMKLAATLLGVSVEPPRNLLFFSNHYDSACWRVAGVAIFK